MGATMRMIINIVIKEVFFPLMDSSLNLRKCMRPIEPLKRAVRLNLLRNVGQTEGHESSEGPRSSGTPRQTRTSPSDSWVLRLLISHWKWFALWVLLLVLWINVGPALTNWLPPHFPSFVSLSEGTNKWVDYPFTSLVKPPSSIFT